MEEAATPSGAGAPLSSRRSTRPLGYPANLFLGPEMGIWNCVRPNSLQRANGGHFARGRPRRGEIAILPHSVGGIAMTDQIQPFGQVMAQLVRPRPGHRHVFAFDELMDEMRIRELCPDPRFVMTARYLSKRWVVNDQGGRPLSRGVTSPFTGLFGRSPKLPKPGSTSRWVCPASMIASGPLLAVRPKNLSCRNIMGLGTTGRLARLRPSTSSQFSTPDGAGHTPVHIWTRSADGWRPISLPAAACGVLDEDAIAGRRRIKAGPPREDRCPHHR